MYIGPEVLVNFVWNLPGMSKSPLKKLRVPMAKEPISPSTGVGVSRRFLETTPTPEGIHPLLLLFTSLLKRKKEWAYERPILSRCPGNSSEFRQTFADLGAPRESTEGFWADW